MKNKIEVSKITINIGDKKVELTLDQAKELQEILNETFPKKEIQWIPSTPIVIERPYYDRPWHYWTPTYCATGNTCGDSSINNMSLSLKSEALPQQ